MHYNPASAKAIRMRIDSETALIVSQPRYISEGLFNRNLVGGIADLFHQGIRNNVTFGALPHYGAKILAAYATEAGFKPELVSLYDPQVVNMAKSSGVTLVSAMDIGLDQARNVFTHLGPSNKILAGGYGISADAQLLHREFPWLTIIPGEAEGVLAHALSDLLNHGQMEPEYRRTSPFNLAQSASEPHLNPHIESKLHNLFGWTPVKVTEVSRGCPEACDFCPTAMLPTSVKPLDVLDTEVQNMHLKPWEPLVFLDQNLMVCPSDYLEALFDYLNQRHILWAGEGTITYLLNSPHLNEAAKHRLLRKMGKNCLAFLVGVEDLNGKTRGSAMKNDIAKSTHLEDMAKLLREYRIPIVYSLIFASDSQEVGYARHAADVVNTLGLTAAAHLATPRIGTQFWNRISREGRLMDERSDRRNMRYDLVHQPTRMTRDEALAEFMLFQALVYEGREIFSRTERNITEIGPRYAAGLWAVDATYWASTKGYIHHHPDIAARVLPSIRKDWLKYIPRT